MMLVPSALKVTLGGVVSPADVKTCVLLTSKSRLLSYTSHTRHPEDLVKVLTSLAAEAWRETQKDNALRGEGLSKEDQIAMIESELGRVVVMPIYPSSAPSISPSPSFTSSEKVTSAQKVVAFPSRDQQVDTADTSGSSNNDGSQSSGQSNPVIFLLALHGSKDVPWGLFRAKGKPLVKGLSLSLSGIGDRLDSGASASPPVGR
ncbi:uncharacterized protein EI90DRAFT_3014153 [Cantharellus anzutake]|uniref:uncharacterized protein n=1 Tax=Cantharellus anzutake TaxID=1750568 RepID=UPI001902D45A|nr:uncharacterized protein EI90DRAFT_3014153 [Cantharellus anzutake]KAF8336378.1 hypothetical protein EI90DRAFT_3014153 [Cantharellus anzutake]